MSLQSVESQIMNILSTISGVATYDYEPKDLSSLPAITLQYSSFEQHRLSYGRRMIVYTFVMRLYVALDDSDKVVMDKTKSLIQQVLDAFHADADLNGTVILSEVTSGALDLDVTSVKPRYISTFTLQVQEEV
ncbi:hypothetical protein H1164_03545 [Thermoactinomyces daqus]|uniref:DUF3168 domain-containing protein n=1 Tax=Thermoactinomyces daqus TaxID=1329516 RepID=A0A7W2AG94_9BACL|nr:hypothetical protein [Thermoactinomyces daqus]MBA4541977.1 hypothetical protein [Thermoactinomyces daqus]